MAKEALKSSLREDSNKLKEQSAQVDKELLKEAVGTAKTVQIFDNTGKKFGEPYTASDPKVPQLSTWLTRHPGWSLHAE
jgi:hypothetical protein